MSGHTRFSVIRDRLYAEHPESRRRVASTLAELRRRQARTQVDMADAMGIQQGAISRLERQNDLLLSTLVRYVAAMGGRLRLIAEYDDGTEVEIALPKGEATS